ncbi:hypothetical protein FA95DRAFT_1502997 [Auriscalpium vulgare]|uniref:Uncharacterized protein n=1 Tax=Auriscalpium vulgare TaxID=40419 RepID=A0ACB8R8V2_9AGAM|nr:hypothetical protein FA95DRAFT_1502997 [Auriscalpium vulgare]
MLRAHHADQDFLLQRRGYALSDWLPFRDTFLDELIRHDGLLENAMLPHCRQCPVDVAEPGQFKCSDCTGGLFLCAGCIVSAHKTLPLHRVQKWTGTFFEPAPLHQLGLRIQLGHDGAECPVPFRRKSPIIVIDVTGIHEVFIDYCDCAHTEAGQHIVQLMRASWWPATVNRPSTVTTIATLKLFHALNLQGKINAYDFYNGLVRITDGLGTRHTKYRYKEFVRSMRCFRNIRAVKRAGRGHDPAGIDATAPGELAVVCPMCPHPGRNMPEGWENASDDEAWKHALFLAIDANFKLKMKNRKLSDIELSPGWGYFVNTEAYDAFLKDYIDEPEMKHCDSNHSARDHANTPAQKRFAINGVGAIICSRHCFYLKHCMGDLQRGERYCNMDYMVLSSLAMTAAGIKKFVISYDIACSYHKNFASRMMKHPPERRLPLDEMYITWAVPKFHLLAHGNDCQTKLNLDLTEWVGRTHGEGVETGWADLNPAALSTREMAFASRHELLDDILGGINWRKVIRIGNLMKAAFKRAIQFRAQQRVTYDDFDKALPEDTRAMWQAMVDAYDKDRKSANPYSEPVQSEYAGLGLARGLADEEAQDAAQGQLSLHETTASVFLSVGMELEDQQRVLRSRSTATTSADKAAEKEKFNVLRHRISSWRSIQQIYMPGVAHLIAPTAALDDDQDISTVASPDAPYNTPLYLPSQLPPSLRESGCAPGLVEKEKRLRRAQAEDSLHQIRRALRTRLGLVHYKHIHVDGPGNKANTRAHDLIARHNKKLGRYVQRYRAARAALVILDPDGNWKELLRELEDSHIRSPRPESDKLGKGKFEVPWIWTVIKPDSRDMVRDDGASEEEILDSFRVDWAHARARWKRWDEEIALLLEEMRRAIRDLEYRAAVWESKATARSDAQPDIRSGLHAFAHRQARHARDLAHSFVNTWRPLLRANSLPELWNPSEYALISAPGDSIPVVALGPSQDSSESSSDSDSSDSDDSAVEVDVRPVAAVIQASD